MAVVFINSEPKDSSNSVYLAEKEVTSVRDEGNEPLPYLSSTDSSTSIRKKYILKDDNNVCCQKGCVLLVSILSIAVSTATLILVLLLLFGVLTLPSSTSAAQCSCPDLEGLMKEDSAAVLNKTVELIKRLNDSFMSLFENSEIDKSLLSLMYDQLNQIISKLQINVNTSISSIRLDAEEFRREIQVLDTQVSILEDHIAQSRSEILCLNTTVTAFIKQVNDTIDSLTMEVINADRRINSLEVEITNISESVQVLSNNSAQERGSSIPDAVFTATLKQVNDTIDSLTMEVINTDRRINSLEVEVTNISESVQVLSNNSAQERGSSIPDAAFTATLGGSDLYQGCVSEPMVNCTITRNAPYAGAFPTFQACSSDEVSKDVSGHYTTDVSCKVTLRGTERNPIVASVFETDSGLVQCLCFVVITTTSAPRLHDVTCTLFITRCPRLMDIDTLITPN